MYKNKKGQIYQAGISLLSDGYVHFYVDFGYLVPSETQFYADVLEKPDSYMIKQRRVVQIATDLEMFYFRVESDGEKNEYFHCSLDWRQRLGFNSSK